MQPVSYTHLDVYKRQYLYKQYSDNAFKDVHAVNTFINYDLPLRKVFNKMSFLLRYDTVSYTHLRNVGTCFPCPLHLH